MTEQDLIDQCHGFTMQYVEQFGHAVVLGVLSRRFGTAARRRFGKSILELIQTDARFLIKLNEAGATNVVAMPEALPPGTII